MKKEAFLKLRKPLRIALCISLIASGICLILLLSTIVTLTSGTMPVFMLAEPVVLLAAVVGFAVCTVNARKCNF